MLRRLLNRSLLRTNLAKSSFWVLIGNGTVLVLQALRFVFLARLLGIREYGLYAAAMALAMTVARYSDLGFIMLFMQQVSRDRSAAKTCLGNAFVVTVATTTILCTVALFVGSHITGAANEALLLVLMFSQCLLCQLANIAAIAFLTLDKAKATACVRAIASAPLTVSVLVMLPVVHHATALEWGVVSLAVNGVAAAITVIWIAREVGGIAFEANQSIRLIPSGLKYSVANSSTMVYNDIDKVILAHDGFVRENGFYTLAYRAIDVAAAPVLALAAASQPRFFQLSDSDRQRMGGFLARTASIAVLISVVMVVLLLLGSPLIPRLVGKDFSQAIVVLRWLCLIPIFRSIHQLTGNALTGMDRQGLRTIIQSAVAILNVTLNIWWIPKLGWMGAAESSLISDGLLAVVTSVFVVLFLKQLEKQPSPA
jgi:O-antigen/teichoic acid export membrane protein